MHSKGISNNNAPTVNLPINGFKSQFNYCADVSILSSCVWPITIKNLLRNLATSNICGSMPNKNTLVIILASINKL